MRVHDRRLEAGSCVSAIVDPAHTQAVMQRVVDAHTQGQAHDSAICARCTTAREAFTNARTRGYVG